jgi:hypothetical protein
MKKIYLSIIAVSATLASAFAQTVPTCSLNPTFIASNKVGVFPDSATNFVSGVVGQPYIQNLTVKVPKDTTSSSITFCFNRFEITTPTGISNYNLPPGLNLGSSTAAVANGTVNGAPSLKFPGNANNCASIYGTPTTAGTYTLNLLVTPFMTPAFGSCPSSPNVSGGSGSLTPPQTLDYYIITILPATSTGIRDIGKDKMALYQNEPNPFSDYTDIKFYVEGEDNATVTVYNALGSIVNQQTIKTNPGENKVTINAANLASGTYIYTLKYKNAITTKRMMVINN